jgi:hypothetical protein
LIAVGTPGSSGARASTQRPIPVLAYYYIWYSPSSWKRAKTDTPLLGRYSSDDGYVMRQQIAWAKAAGITGFIVSWKNTPQLDRRLTKLVAIADQANFKLAVIYEGLDFYRRPLAVLTVRNDLNYFVHTYSKDPAFDLFGKPLVIWSGTWKFAAPNIARTVRPLRKHLLLLASQRNVEDYQRIASVVDGDAYYWSSVNPKTYPDYQGKLDGMAAVVHQHGGLWIAPAAPGFDARLVEGTSVVPRNNGDTLRTEMNTALKSSPDAIGVISWNEFSENSYIEPTRKYGMRYLHVLADLNNIPSPVFGTEDSSAPGSGGPPLGPPTLGILVLVGLGALAIILKRDRRRRAEIRVVL